MGEIITFNAPQEEQYLDDMSREELQEYLEEIQQRIEKLDEKEPKNMNSKAYEDWAEEHEVLEDLVDEIVEMLEEME
jgi:glutamyl-tRNA reductase